MSLALTFACISLCVATCAVLVFALTRALQANAQLRVELSLATEAQRTKDTQISRQSELDGIKDEFISTVSHELRTPLTSIRGALGLLSAGLMGTVDVKAQNLLRIALTNTDRLIRLINDILDLERMQSGRAPLQVRRCSLRELVQGAIETMTPMAETAQVRLVLALNTSPEAVYFDGDPDRILQVLTNLLSNAIKFSPHNTSVKLAIHADEDSVLLRVTDQGRGIPAEKLDSIFDRFQQVEAADARQKGGTGLGLAICRTIIQQHNGSIWAESNNSNHIGPGTTLLVSLPRLSRYEDTAVRAHTPLQDAVALQERTAREPALPQTALAPALEAVTPGGTVLLCDDDPGTRTLVGEHLRRHGYEILEAGTGEDAVQIASQQQVEAILLDLFLPGTTGRETLERLKRSSVTAEIPVVLLSVLSPDAARPDVARPEVNASLSGWMPSLAANTQGLAQRVNGGRALLSELLRAMHTGDGRPHVLLIEDDHDFASVLIDSFAETDVHVDHAGTRQQAMAFCQAKRPDLLILDLTLPDGDGFSLVDWLREQPELRALPLVVYSGREVSDAERSKLRLGPTEFLTKASVKPGEVERLVLNIVKKLRAKPASSPLAYANGSSAASLATASAQAIPATSLGSVSIHHPPIGRVDAAIDPRADLAAS